MNIFKKLGNLVASIIPGGGLVKNIISPDKTDEQVSRGLSALSDIAQYNKTLARPRIATMIVGTYLLGVIIQWIQQLFKVLEKDLIDIPGTLVKAMTIIVVAYFGSRGFENIFEKIFKKKDKK